MVDDRLLLRTLRGDLSIADFCAAANLTETEFRAARDGYLRRRLPPTELNLKLGVRATVDIARDARGIPHVFAQTTPDLYYGLGLAMAQDRLWQMDFFRRRGLGTLAEILGPAYLPSDIAHRTLGLTAIATWEVDLQDELTAIALRSFVNGINRWLDEAAEKLPIEFALLDYQPEPWSVRDVLCALRGFWWSLNGRIQSIVAGEAARLLPNEALRESFLTPNLATERILPAGVPYSHSDRQPFRAGSDDGSTGSNNWAVGRARTANGAAILASDPHQPFMLPSNWYECHLVGPEDDVAGAAWAGLPGIWFGRNRRIAWGLTNNNVSLRDLYVEEIDPANPSRYRDGTDWQPFVERSESIAIRGQQSEPLVVRETVRGPIVNHLVPAVSATGDPPLSLHWIGQEHLDDVRALLAVGRASNWTEFRAALHDWAVPTFNWGYADVDGNVGYQCASRLPIRGRETRGFRHANNPADQWQGYVPFDDQPTAFNPPRGFTSSANNAPVPDDFSRPYVGAYAGGERALRIRETLEGIANVDRDACAALQNDTLAAPARQLVPHLLRRLSGIETAEVVLFRNILDDWDYRYSMDSAAPAVFETFFRYWKRRVAAERFPEHLLDLVTGQGDTFARLIESDDLAWFQTDKQAAIVECAARAISWLREEFGDDPTGWAWGSLHRVHLHHPLTIPATADSFDVGPYGVSGTASTVRNTGLGAIPAFAADSGAEYRLIADLGDPDQLWATQNVGQSGQPGSPFYQDQCLDWVRGDYHPLKLSRAAVEAELTSRVRIDPASESEGK